MNKYNKAKQYIRGLKTRKDDNIRDNLKIVLDGCLEDDYDSIQEYSVIKLAYMSAKYGLVDAVYEIINLDLNHFYGPDMSRMKGMRDTVYRKQAINASIHGAMVGNQKDLLIWLLCIPEQRIKTPIADLEIPYKLIEKILKRKEGVLVLDYVMCLNHPIRHLTLNTMTKYPILLQ